ncbi:hypothetical protein BDQ17DRAFT_1427469 [Cyathus striatus]|nr:hypothetical protein BDQ17DRAFT_1427469 [Cyathus striatus]
MQMHNPKGGRGREDPYLNSGEGVGNNQEHRRYGVTSNIDDRTMHVLYWYSFLPSIEADVSSMMCAYNPFNGTSSYHNENLIGPNGLLQKAGFKCTSLASLHPGIALVKIRFIMLAKGELVKSRDACETRRGNLITLASVRICLFDLSANAGVERKGLPFVSLYPPRLLTSSPPPLPPKPPPQPSPQPPPPFYHPNPGIR